MKVFVTGATGFVTGTVTMHLLARGDEVRALVRDASRGRTLARVGTAVAAISRRGARTGMEGSTAVGTAGELEGYPTDPTARDVRSERPRHRTRP